MGSDLSHTHTHTLLETTFGAFTNTQNEKECGEKGDKDAAVVAPTSPPPHYREAQPADSSA